MTTHVVPVVEGVTEEGCIKLLLSRVWRDLLGAGPDTPLAVLEPVPMSRSAFVRPAHPELASKVERAARTLRGRLRPATADRGFILLVLDADEDCPATLGPELLARARIARADMDIACVLPKRELENWFKAAATSLAGVNGLPDDLVVPPEPEVGSGDTWLTQQMQKRDRKRKYTKPADALELTKRMDLQQCQDNSPSFDKLCRDLESRLPASGANGPAAAPDAASGTEPDAAPEGG